MCSENDVSVDTGMRVLGSELQVGPAGGVQSSAGREARWTGPQVLHKLTFTAGLGPLCGVSPWSEPGTPRPTASATAQTKIWSAPPQAVVALSHLWI